MLNINKKTEKSENPQGISSSGNALRNIVVLALLISLTPAVLGFAYLVLIREPDLQRQQIERVSAAYAVQQAVNIQQLVSHLTARLAGAAQSPLALSAIEDESGDNLALIEQTMLDYFPEVTSLHILPIGELGTAEFARSNQGLRNHIEVDLVRRASVGDKTLPESYKFEEKWLTSLAFLVSHPRDDTLKAVIIATIDNQLIITDLKALDGNLGQSIVRQTIYNANGTSSDDDVAMAGSGDALQYSQSVSIPGTSWTIVFTPSPQLLESLAIPSVSLMGIAIMVLIAGIVGAALVMVLFSKALLQEIDRVITAADRKTSLSVKIPELVSIAKQLRRATLRSLRQVKSPATSGDGATASELTGAMASTLFQNTQMLDDEDDLELGIAPSTAASAVRAPAYTESDHIFRAYDIRGNAKTELADEMVTQIGSAIGSLAHEAGEQTLIIGSDGRSSSPRIKAGLIKALMESGRDVIDIGTVPTPLLYFATRYLPCKSGIMVTGSHNPAEDNGFKVVLKQQTIAAGGITAIRDRMREGRFTKGAGRIMREDVMPNYIEEVVNDIAVAVPLKIVIDAGNGVTGLVAPALFEELGCEVVPLYCDIDGRFPNHPPDTSNEENLTDLVAKVREEKADFGVAFDGDGDRLAVVSSSGKIVRSDVLLMLFAKDVVSRNPGADVVFDVKCSRNLSQLITKYGGRPVLWKTGHAFMKEKMLETGALLGGEFSGHMFFRERWYGFDDGMYAAGRLAEILSTNGATLDESLAELPDSVSTPEIIIPVDEAEKFIIIDKVVRNSDFSSGKVNTLDGIRVDFRDGWGLLRASNTSAALTARFEATSEGALEAIKQEFRAQIGLVHPGLDLNF